VPVLLDDTIDVDKPELLTSADVTSDGETAAVVTDPALLLSSVLDDELSSILVIVVLLLEPGFVLSSRGEGVPTGRGRPGAIVI